MQHDVLNKTGPTSSIRHELYDFIVEEIEKLETIHPHRIEAVIMALNSTERTSSMVENLNSRLRPYLFSRREIGNGYLGLLRFFLNHKPFERSDNANRKGKSPAELLAGKPHPHWLEMLGYTRFSRAA